MRPQLLLSDEALALELARMTDHRTDEIFRLAGSEAHRVVYPVSRLVVDPERFRDDAQEPMASIGMGAIYTRTSHGEPLRRSPGRGEREALLARFYDPHHAALRDAVGSVLCEAGHCLVVDCHSFPSVPLPYETDALRPDVCLGLDGFHTLPGIAELAFESFRHAGLDVEINRPFSGALVPAPFSGRDRRVSALMIEINRGLYLNEQTAEPSASFDSVRERVRSVVREVARATAELVRNRGA